MTFLICLGAALGCGLISGVFLAFSSFVMPALARLPAPQGVSAMQSINVAVVNPLFMGVLFGTALACLALGLGALRAWSEPGSGYRLLGAALFLLGSIGVTLACNVPLNEALAHQQANSAQAAQLWPSYVATWSTWNHVRGIAALCAAALFTLSLLRGRVVSAHMGSLALALCALTGCSAPLRPVPAPGAAQPVARLSELGLFQGDLSKQTPRSGVVPYDVNASLYADGATKRRFIVLPPGTQSSVNADRWQVPVGTYFVKTFSFPRDVRNPGLGEQLVETRFLIRTDDGYIASSYVWNAAQTDAVASSGDVDVPVSSIDETGVRRDRVFHVPSASQCTGCHEDRALAWRSRQLDHAQSYADGSRDQISHLLALGVIGARPPAHEVLADPFGAAPLALRARSYLDANCSHCHAVGGSAERTGLFWDLEHTTASELPACRDTRQVDGRDHVLVPGHPDQSEFLARMRSTSAHVHMPRGPLQATDYAGIALLSAWVSALPSTTCAD